MITRGPKSCRFTHGKSCRRSSVILNNRLIQFLSLRHYGSELNCHGLMPKVTGLATSTRNITLHEKLESGEGNTNLILDNFRLIPVYAGT